MKLWRYVLISGAPVGLGLGFVVAWFATASVGKAALITLGAAVFVVFAVASGFMWRRRRGRPTKVFFSRTLDELTPSTPGFRDIRRLGAVCGLFLRTKEVGRPFLLDADDTGKIRLIVIGRFWPHRLAADLSFDREGDLRNYLEIRGASFLPDGKYSVAFRSKYFKGYNSKSTK